MKVNVLVDSSGWIEYFADTANAGKYARLIEKASKSTHFTPTVIVYEVFRKLKKEAGEKKALGAIAHIIDRTTIVELTERTAIHAAELSLQHDFSLADSIILATALEQQAQIFTGDRHFKKIRDAQII